VDGTDRIRGESCRLKISVLRGPYLVCDIYCTIESDWSTFLSVLYTCMFLKSQGIYTIND